MQRSGLAHYLSGEPASLMAMQAFVNTVTMGRSKEVITDSRVGAEVLTEKNLGDQRSQLADQHPTISQAGISPINYLEGYKLMSILSMGAS